VTMVYTHSDEIPIQRIPLQHCHVLNIQFLMYYTYYLLQLFDVIKYYIDQVRSPKRPTKHINTTPHSKALINVSNKNKGSELMFCCKILCLILLCLLSYSLFSAYVVVVTSSLDFVQYKVQADYLILEH